MRSQCVPKNAVSELRKNNLIQFTVGFNDRIRNGISHGQINFRADGIQYGDDKGTYLISVSEFLNEYDELCRTTNSLALAFLLFIGRHNKEFKNNDRKVPLSIICAVVSALFDSEGIKINGIIESDYKLVGPQLHVSLKLYQASRMSHIWHSTYISIKLIELGISKYNYYLFDIDCGKAVSSTMSVIPKKLAHLIETGASMDRVGEIYDMQRSLLWSDESTLMAKVKMYKLIFKERFKLFKETLRVELTKKGMDLKYSYNIKSRKVIKGDNIKRVEIHAVLNHPVDSLAKNKITQIVLHIAKKNSKMVYKSQRSMLSKKMVQLPFMPDYVSINLYRLDGPIRWISAGGWPGGNLIAVAEYIKLNKLKPLVVEKPEAIVGKVRIRYSADQEAIKKVQDEILNLVEQLHSTAAKNNE